MNTKIFDTLLEPVFVINESKKILYCNEAAALICDISSRKIIRQSLEIDQIFSFSEPVPGFSELTNVSEPTPYLETAFTTGEGKSGKIQITIQGFGAHDSQNTWLVFFRDVTLEETLQKKYRKELEQKEGVIVDLKKAQNTLEKYSKNLEIMVAERTAALRGLNQKMSALLDSLGQGFFIFNKDGLCLEVFSKACESVLENKPSGQKVWDILKLREKEIPGFQKWMTTLFSEMLPFEDLSPLGPQTYPHSQGRHIQLEYYPLRGADKNIQGVVVVATDITSLVEAKKEAETERSLAKMIVSLVQNKRQVKTFIQETEALLQELHQEFSKASPQHEVVFRCLHTLKGGAATFSIQAMVNACHVAENILAQWKISPHQSELQNELGSRIQKIQGAYDLFIEENQNILGTQQKSKERWVEAPISQFFDFSKYFFTSDQIRKAFIEEFVMEPIGLYFEGFQEIISNVAERELKQILPLELKNSQIKIFPEAYTSLFSTLVHAFRNAVDHGIEMPHLRVEKGKSEKGRVQVFFDVVSEDSIEWLNIQICDDGAGVDPNIIREKLLAKGYDCSHESDLEVIQHIFDANFSTRDEVTEISGRGVGMDAIQFVAKKMGGSVSVQSKPNHGTTLNIKVPFVTEVEFKTSKAA